MSRTRKAIVVTPLLVGLVIGGSIFLASRRDDAPASRSNAPRSVPLRIVEGDLAYVRTGGCRIRPLDDTGVTAEIPGPVVENQGNQALIMSTEFRALEGDREWGSTKEWRVPVGEAIEDVSLLTTESSDAVQQVGAGVDRCILFVETKGTYLPPPEGGPPSGPGAKLGKSYDYSWYAHCGANILLFDGRWWKPSPPLSDDPHNPPPGWDDNERGHIELLSEHRARFTGRRGQVANLGLTKTPKEDPFGGCE